MQTKSVLLFFCCLALSFGLFRGVSATPPPQDPPTEIGSCAFSDPVTTNSCGPLTSVVFTWSQRDPGTCDDNGNITGCRYIGNAAAKAPSLTNDKWWVCFVDNTDDVTDACKDSAEPIELDANGNPIPVNFDVRYLDIACGQAQTLRFHFFRIDSGEPATPCKIKAVLNCGSCTFSGQP